MQNQINRFLNNSAIIIYLIFSALLLGSILVLRPGWGFMDDYGNLKLAHEFWAQPSIQHFLNYVQIDLDSGRFRPIYSLWIIWAYKLGESGVFLIYFWTTLCGLLILPLWGRILDIVFNKGRNDPFLIWIYPLSFFIFTPFWNIFMYISVQEKFIYFFSAPAVYFFLKSYEKQKFLNFLLALIFSALATLGKETGAALLLAFVAYALLDLLIFKINWRWSGIIALISGTLFTIYYIFIKGLIKNYSYKYQQGLQVTKLLSQISASPLVIKCLMGLSVFTIALIIIKNYTNSKSKNNSEVLFPCLLLSYLLVLLPWGYPTYLLAPVGVFTFATLTPLFYLNQLPQFLSNIQRLLLIGCSFLIVLFIIIPKVQKMADKNDLVVQTLQIFLNNKSAVFYYPAPYEETAAAIQSFTKAPVIYLKDSNLVANKIMPNSYLITNDECLPVNLFNIVVKETVFHNSTWQINRVVKDPLAANSTFKGNFDQNLVQQIKNLIKKL